MFISTKVFVSSIWLVMFSEQDSHVQSKRIRINSNLRSGEVLALVVEHNVLDDEAAFAVHTLEANALAIDDHLLVLMPKGHLERIAFVIVCVQ